MESDLYIIDHCIIRDKTIRRNNEVLYTGSEDMPGPFFTQSYKHFGFSYPKFYKMDNLCKLGFLASEVLMTDISLTDGFDSAQPDAFRKAEDFGIILYNAGSSIDTDRTHQQSIIDRNSYFPSPSVFVYTLPNIVIGEICIRHKIFGESAFFITEKFDPVALCKYVTDLFNDDVIQSCFTGWIECDAGHYNCMLLRVGRQSKEKEGIAIFDAGIIKDIYIH